MPTSFVIDDSAQAGLYKSYTNNNSFKYITGLVIVPLAADTPATGATEILPKIVRLHQPYSIRRQTFDAVKEQTPPVMPAPTTDDTLLSSSVVVPMPQLNQTGAPSFTFAVGGEYLYLGRTAYSATTGYPAGLWPFNSESLKKMQGTIYGLGAIGGAVLSSFNALAALGPTEQAFATGNYTWPFQSIIPTGFFDSSLSSSLYVLPFGTQ